MTLPEHHLDDAVAAHRGDPPSEQRAMARTAAVVDRGNRGIIAVSGEERLSWLHLLLTQHVSDLPEGGATEALVLDGQGRVLHHMGVAHVDGVVYLDVEAGELPVLLDYLKKMVGEKFEAFTFSPVGASVYHLGNFGTARKKLKGWELKR